MVKAAGTSAVRRLTCVRRLTWGLLLSGVALASCARPAQVQSSQLPVKRVVVYRNGVAYFERSGEVDEEQVQFQLREENVGDFLATLAIMERGGSTVRAASFPVTMDEQDEAQTDPELQRALDAWDRKKRDPRKIRQVTLELDGQRHDLTVGYLAETPLWRPSYRLVVDDDGTASLQVWGIVQNQSGEDWTDVEIALVAGAPIAFKSTLGDPVVPERPLVTDQGEVVMAVPRSGRTLHQSEELEAPAEEAPAEDYDDGYTEQEANLADKAARKMRGADESADGAVGGYGYGFGTDSLAAPAPASAPRPSPGTMSVAPQQAASLAQIEVQSGATRYEVPHRVTIPDESATMVLLVSKKVPGEAVHLYAPDPGVPESQRHPFRVARFTNTSGGLLEKGPIAVFEEGAFLGQGVLSSLPVKAEATVPFALVRDLAIEKEYESDQRDVRLYAVRSGSLFIERDRALLATYRVQNGDQESVRLLIKHSLSRQAKLHEPPKGTDVDLAEGVAYVPVVVPKFGKAEVVVEERMPMQTSVAWSSIDARRAIEKYLQSGAASSAEEQALRTILSYAEKLAEAADQQRKARREQSELEKSARETRLSLEAIEKNPRAAELRSELTQRLAKTTRRLEEITKELVEIGLRQTEAEVRLKDATQALEIPPRK